MPKEDIIRKTMDHRGVCHLTFNMPDDTYDDAIISEFNEALLWCNADRRVRTIMIESKGDSFAKGPDASWLGRIVDYDYAANLVDTHGLARALFHLYHMGKPTIAKVHGKALGLGVGIIAACDVAVADYQATFQVTDVRLGLTPSLIAPYLSQAIGSRHALRYLTSGEEFDSVDAQRTGLVQEVVAREKLNAVVEKLVVEFLKGGPRAMRATKEIVRTTERQAVDEDILNLTVEKASERRSSREGSEGISAYLGDGKPFWLP